MNASRELTPYDKQRYYWTTGDVINLSNYARLVVIGGNINECTAIVNRSGFGMKKGDIVTLKINETPYITKSEYRKEKNRDYKLQTDFNWQVGDVVKINGVLFILVEHCRDVTYNGLCLGSCDDNEAILAEGDIVMVNNPMGKYLYHSKFKNTYLHT